jgi:acetyltransferase-like isoleucine patch superfamily enzyme
VQAVALVDDHVNVNVDAVPLLTVLGPAERVTAGPDWVIETVADCVALPPGPVRRPRADCLLFQQVTIEPRGSGIPKIEGHVDIGAGAKILGAVTVGRHAKIGANAVVLRDVPAGATAIGVPAKITLQ